MRGLTDAEHTVLTIMAALEGRPASPDRPYNLTEQQVELCVVLQATRGLCVVHYYETFVTCNITECGRLALRIENMMRVTLPLLLMFYERKKQ